MADDRKDDGREEERKEPTHAPGEDARPGRRGPQPYPVNDPELTDPRKTRGAEPDLTPVPGAGRGGGLPSM
ncbi:hypothetical protein [Salinarimonas ramus]|uniref:Uncharacterized protein n=1 Tax=Salinarimonas ramus TaxID=690164 RepID=A0A917V608_9HYPH|nr:hypothetical protein [Salinarimonas ramus]GGK42447.1 hypothetical protein GCM10011322_32000 [Salinarimonas ramus]